MSINTNRWWFGPCSTFSIHLDIPNWRSHIFQRAGDKNTQQIIIASFLIIGTHPMVTRCQGHGHHLWTHHGLTSHFDQPKNTTTTGGRGSFSIIPKTQSPSQRRTVGDESDFPWVVSMGKYPIKFENRMIDRGSPMTQDSPPKCVFTRPGWWFGCHQFYFSRNIGLLSSSQLTNSNLFQEGWPNHQPVYCWPDCIFPQEKSRWRSRWLWAISWAIFQPPTIQSVEDDIFLQQNTSGHPRCGVGRVGAWEMGVS